MKVVIIIIMLSVSGFCRASSSGVALQTTWTMSNAPLFSQKAWFDPSSNVTLIRELLKKDKDVDAINEDGITGLMLVAGRGDREAVEAFLDAGADVNVQNPLNGRTALHYAIYNASTTVGIQANPSIKEADIIRILLEAGASVAIADKKGMCAIHMVPNIVGTDHFINTLGLLLKYGADVNQQTAPGPQTFGIKNTAPVLAAGVLVPEHINTGFTILHQLANADDFIGTRDSLLKYWGLIVNYSIKASIINFPAVDQTSYLTPFEYATDLGFSDVAGFIRDASIKTLDVDVKNIDKYYLNGLTGISYAVVGKKKEIVRKFIEKKANPFLTSKKAEGIVNAASHDGCVFNALHLAVLQADMDIVDMLIGYEPRLIFVQDTNGNTVFHLLTHINDVNKQIGIFDLIAKKIMNSNNFSSFLNQQNNKGKTLLHILVSTKNQILLQHIVDTYGKKFNHNLVDKRQNKAEDYAHRNLAIDIAAGKDGTGAFKKAKEIERDNRLIEYLKTIR